MKSTSNSLKRLAIAAAIACALPLAAQAQGMPDGRGPGGAGGATMMHGGGEGHHMGGRHGRGEMGFLRGVNLTEVQRDKIFAIKYAQMPAQREKMKAVRKAHEDLRALSTSPQYDEARVKAAADAGARAMADLTVMRTRTRHEIYAVLTPEQRTQVEKNRAERRERMERWQQRGERGEHGRGPGMAPKQ